MPEPPAFDLSGVNQGITPAVNPNDPRVHYLPALAATVPGGAVVRITNLDTPDPVFATNAAKDGSFLAAIMASDGQELRFEWVDGAERSQPADALFVQPLPTGAITITPSPRFDCLTLSPGFALAFSGAAQASVTLKNGCAGDLTLDNPRTRLALPDFTLTSALPLRVAAGQSAKLSVTFARGAAGLREDVLFVDVTTAGTTLRYPITLRAE